MTFLSFFPRVCFALKQIETGNPFPAPVWSARVLSAANRSTTQRPKEERGSFKSMHAAAQCMVAKPLPWSLCLCLVSSSPERARQRSLIQEVK